jgi:hypothetical protein
VCVYACDVCVQSEQDAANADDDTTPHADDTSSRARTDTSAIRADRQHASDAGDGDGDDAHALPPPSSEVDDDADVSDVGVVCGTSCMCEISIPSIRHSNRLHAIATTHSAHDTTPTRTAISWMPPSSEC